MEKGDPQRDGVQGRDVRRRVRVTGAESAPKGIGTPRVWKNDKEKNLTQTAYVDGKVDMVVDGQEFSNYYQPIFILCQVFS